MATLVILGPSENEGLRNIRSSDHEEGSEIEDSGKALRDCHNDNISDHRNNCAENAPSVSMVIVVSEICDYYREGEGACIRAD